MGLRQLLHTDQYNTRSPEMRIILAKACLSPTETGFLKLREISGCSFEVIVADSRTCQNSPMLSTTVKQAMTLDR